MRSVVPGAASIFERHVARIIPLMTWLACASCQQLGPSASWGARAPETAVGESLGRPATPTVAVTAVVPVVEQPADTGLLPPLGAAQPDEPIARAEEWPFVDHAVASCVSDGLTSTRYLLQWFQHAGSHRAGPPGGPRPLPGLRLPARGPRAGTASYASARAALVAGWDEAQRHSHVMDCAVRVAPKRQPDGQGALRVPYAIYLPADYLDHPLRPRAILLLASGGGGSRTRWFLSPLHTDGMQPGTGGLEMRGRMDAWAASHPGEAPPLVVAVDGASPAFTNGIEAFIEQELPDHLIATYLPHQTREQTPYGVEAVSSGAMVALRALRANPRLFTSVGLTSLFCAGAGFDPRRDLGGPEERRALFAELAERRAHGQFDLRFSIGALDQYWDCNYRLFHDLSTAGVLPAEAGPSQEKCAAKPWRPTTADPPSSPVVSHCAGRWASFESWFNTAHHYRAVVAALPSALDWNLNVLSRALAQGAAPVETGPTP